MATRRTSGDIPGKVPGARAEATRQALVKAALAEFSQRSFDVVSMDDIADAAGVAHGLAFHYFGSKRGLYLEALREVASRLQAVHAVDVPGTPGDRVRAMLTRHLHFMRRHAALARHLFRGGLGTDPEAWRIIDATRDAATAWIARELGLAPASPALVLTLRMMSGAADEATVHWLEHRRVATLDGLVDVLIDMLAAALSAAAQLDPRIDVAAALRELRRRSVR